MSHPSAFRTLRPVLLTVLLDLLGFGLVIPLLSYYAETFGADAVQVTLLMACYSVAQFLFAPFWGAMSDRFGRRPIMLISIAGTALSLASFASSNTLIGLFICRTLNGAFAANISTAQAVVADVTSPEERARGMGLIGASFGIGFTLGPWFGGELSTFGLSAPIWVAALLSGVNFVWAWFGLPETRSKTPSQAKSNRTIDPRALVEALRHPVVGLSILLMFVATLAFSMMEATFPLVAEHAWSMGAHHVGRMFLFIGLISVLMQGGLIHRLVKRFGEPRLVVAGLLLNATGLAALSAAAAGNTLTNETFVVFARWGGCALLAAGTSLMNPSLNALISKGTAADEQGAVLGSNQSLSALARALGPTAGGFLYRGWFLGAAFATGALLLVGALPIALPAVRRYGTMSSMSAAKRS